MRRALVLLPIVALFALQLGKSQDKGKLSLLAYVDYFYNIQRDPAFGSFSNTALSGGEAFQAFQFRRIYFTYDYTFTEDVSSRFRLEADQSALTSDGKIGVFVKDAYLRWKNVLGNDVFLGIQGTPAFEVSEGAWGYRSLEKTIMDLRGAVSSRDFGVGVRGSFDNQGALGYWFMLGNGNNNKPENDKLKRYYGHVSVRLRPIEVTLYADFNPRPEITNPFTGGRVGNSTLTTAGFVGFEPVPNIRLGVEGFIQMTPNAYNTGTSLRTRNGLGISGFLRWSFAERLEFVGRYDHFDPNTNSSAVGDSRGYVLAGVSWATIPNVQVIPNVQIETFEKSGTQSFESSITGRITVSWSLP
ncbi:MAG: hypothetical protein WEB37_09610 [Bacteroidota bacterium]